MAQHDYNIANQSFPSFRSDLNNALSAIQTTNSGTSRPTGAVAGQLWLDTTSATTPTLKYYDGADDISLATIDHTANTVNWLDSTVSITGLSTTATGTVLTLTDSASTSTVNLIIDNQKEIRFRETTANGTNYVALKAPASLSADVTYTLPVAPTANNQALISSTAGAMSFTPYSFPSSDGTSGQALVTNGSGALSFGSSVPEQLVKSMPLASGNSVTAGKLLSLGTSGEVVAYPTLNTLGTTRTNSNATAYGSASLTGDTAIRASQVFTGGSQVITFTGIAISNSANPTNGGTTVTHSNGFGASFGISFYPIGASKFLVRTTYTYNIACFGSGGATEMFIIAVDPTTGNCTKGNVVNVGGAASMSVETGIITKDVYASRMNTTYYIVRNTTGNTLAITSDADALDWVGADLKNSIRTTNNILGIGIGATWRVATYTTTPTIGTKTDTTQITDYLSNGQWCKMGLSTTDDAEYMIVTYTNTSSVARYITYSVNQTTGALTQVETGLQSLLANNGGSSFVFKDKNSFVGTDSTFAFTNGAKNTSFINTPYTLGTIRYNSSNLFYSFSTDVYGYPTNTGFTVNAYGTNSFNYLGVAKTTDSTTPVDVVTDGVANGFTSLTAGTLYYATSPADGTVTTSSASGLLIGKAISSTEILLQRSNTQ